MIAEIISIGNELLNGNTTNTNATHIAKRLHENGINTEHIQTIRDTEKAIRQSLELALSRSQVVMVTGGLGPTHDDVTKHVVSSYFDSELEFNEKIYQRVKQKFASSGLEMPEVNRSQAMLPKDVDIMQNRVGTAPGMIFRDGEKLVFVMPGVPQEMKAMLEDFAIPRLRQECPECRVQVDLFRTTGIAESAIYEKVEKELANFSSYEIAFLPRFTGVDIRVIRGGEDIENTKKFEKFKKILYNIIGDSIYASEDLPLEAVLGQIFRKNKLTVAIAESLTGGLVQDRLTDIPGSSEYFLGGIVSYSNESKVKQLYVNPDSLEKQGAVSEIVAGEMAEGVSARFGSDVGVSTTGIAGPGGATPSKPVGLVYVGVWFQSAAHVLKFQFSEDRQINKERAAQAALDLTRRVVLGLPTKTMKSDE